MKNIHVLPTDKPSRLYNCFGKLEIGDYVTTRESLQVTNQNIYITSDEEIKEEDWYYLPRTNSVHKCIEDPAELNLERRLGVAKIILTTDQDLIKDGVQAIDDEFLEWFVKNPNCEDVEVKSWIKTYEDGSSFYRIDYEIIIPNEEPKPHSFCETPEEKCKMNYCDENGCQNRKRELVEPKQETLEQVAHKILDDYGIKSIGQSIGVLEVKKLMVKMAKWQQEQDLSMVQGYLSANLQNIELLKRMYSEEEVLQIIKNAFNQGERYGWGTQSSIGNIDEMKSKIPFISLEKYLETFKNK